MHRWIFLLLAVVFGVGAAGAAYMAWRGEDQRGLVPSRPIYDCGEVEQGAKVRHEFEVVNRMGETLTIKEVVRSCGCSEARCEPGVLRPGERGVVSAVWDVGGVRGKNRVMLYVIGLLPDESRVASELIMLADVKPDIEYSPTTLKFTPSARVQTIRFLPGTQAEFALKEVYCGHKAFTAQIVPGRPAVAVTFQPALWNTDLGESELNVVTTSKHQPVCRIALTVAKDS